MVSLWHRREVGGWRDGNGGRINIALYQFVRRIRSAYKRRPERSGEVASQVYVHRFAFLCDCCSKNIFSNCKSYNAVVYYDQQERKEVIYMAVLTEEKTYVDFDKNESLRSALDRGIDDMEAGRELPLDEAMKKITELRNIRRNARL